MQRSRAVTDEVRVCMDKHGADVLLMQEPCNARGVLPGLGGSTAVILGDSTGATVQAAVAIRTAGYTAVKISHLCNTHCVVVQMVSGSGNGLYLVSQYFQYSDDIEPYLAHLGKVLNELRGCRVLIAADVNAKSTQWGRTTRPDARGEALECFLAQHDLVCLNKVGCPATFSNAHGESDIDVTLVTSNMLSLVRSWNVRVDWTSSDHRVIEIVLGLRDTDLAPSFTERRFRTDRADWTKFTSALLEAQERTLATAAIERAADVERMAELVEQAIISACNASMRVKSSHSRTVPWWTPRLTRTKKQVYKCRRAYQCERDPGRRAELRAKYRSARKAYHTAIKKARLSSWRDFVSKHGNDEPWGLVYRITSKKRRPCTAISNIRTAMGHTLSWRDTAMTLLNALIPDDDSTNETQEQLAMRAEAAMQPNTEDTPCFLWEEVAKAVSSLKNGKCPGLDRVEVEVVKRAFGCIHSDLLRLYNGCLQWGVFPSRWKVGSILTLLKSNDKDPCDVKSYRPITLLSVLGKILEKLISARLSPVYMDSRFCSERQYGFRTGRSTEDAIVKFRSLVAQRTEKYVLALSFDISGAFDNVWWPSVMSSLRKRDCPKNLYRLVEDYFANRTVKIVTQCGEVEKGLTKGCPQGSVIGPSFWNLVFDDLLTRLSTTEGIDCEPIAYADDVLVIVYGKSRNEIQERGQKVADLVCGWASSQKLLLSSAKSEMLLVKGKLDLRRPPVIKLYGKSISLKSSMRYLGLHVDQGLKIGTHTKKLSAKCRDLFNRFAEVARAKWGLGYRALSILYKGLFVPIVTYAAAGWADLLNAVTRRELMSAQRLALIRLTKAYRTVSAEALPVIAGVLPIDLAIIERMHQYKVRRGIDFTVGGFTFNYEEAVAEDATPSSALSAVREAVLNMWQERWANSERGRTTFEFFEDVRERLGSHWISADHSTTQFLSGHGDFRDRLHKLALVPDNRCLCGEEETSWHVLFQCDKYAEQRQLLRAKAAESGLAWPVAAAKLVSAELFGGLKRFARTVVAVKEKLWRQ